MVAYEFFTEISDTHQVIIPDQIARAIPSGAAVRILILVNEQGLAMNGHAPAPQTLLSPLEELVAEIKRTPPKPEHFHPGSGLLAEHLANPVTEPDPDFDVEVWNQEWDRIETQMKAEELAHEQEELKSLFP